MSYTAADITELDDVQHTRLRPAVNLGLDVLNTALRELMDNAIEEVADPSHGGSTVTITLHADGSVSVADDGRGLPIDSDPVNGKNGIVKTLGTARAGGKFSAHVDATSTGAGLNGIGAAAAVFISARTDVTVQRGGKTYLQSFGGGYPGEFEGTDFDPDASFTRADTQKLRGSGNRKPNAHGTTVRILFDAAVVPDSTVDINEVLLRAHAAARMSPGVHLIVVDDGWPGDVVRPELLEPFRRTVGQRDPAGPHVRRRRYTRARRARSGGGPRRVHHRPRPHSVSLVPDRRPRRTSHRRRVLQHRAHPRRRIASDGRSEGVVRSAGRSRFPHPRPGPGQGRRRAGGTGFRRGDRTRRGYPGTRRVLGLAGQDRGVVTLTERGDGPGRGAQRDHLGGQSRQCRCGVAVDEVGPGIGPRAAQRRGRQGPVPGGVEGQGSRDEPVAAAEAAAQPGDRPRVGRRVVPLRGRLGAGHHQGGQRRHVPGGLPAEGQAAQRVSGSP